MGSTIARAFNAGAAITAYSIVKFDTVEGQVILATANTDSLLGAVGQLGANAAGETVEVQMSSQERVVLGGTVTRGDMLTSDANGKAVSITNAATQAASVFTIGQALQSGVSGDIIYYRPSISKISKGVA